MTLKQTARTVLAVAMGGLAVVSSAGCDIGPGIDLCGDAPTHQEQQAVCDGLGTAHLQAPARLNLPATLSNTYARSCLSPDGGCLSQPFVTFESPARDGTGTRGYLNVQIFLPAGERRASYTLPPPPSDSYVGQPYGTVTLYSRDGASEQAYIASGTITVTRSTRDELRVDLALTLLVPATGETLSISTTNGGATCDIKTVTVCEWGLG